MDLFEETERVKLLLVKAYARLQRLGHITAEELDEIIDAVGRLDDLTDEEFEATLGKYRQLIDDPDRTPAS